jgi:molybdenum cofactor biosynthesis protein MoaC
MKSTSEKIETLRRATAESVLHGPPHVITALMRGDTPKGNAIDVARVAGISAAKRTWDLIPYCHPMPIDQITVSCEASESTIMVRATVTAIWKTGVEMEALTAASVAALTLYDMAKAMDTALVIQNTRLVEKRGGKTDFADKPFDGFRAAVLVTSDGTAAGTREDKSGKIIRDYLSRVGVTDASYTILPDDREKITDYFKKMAAEGVHLILTTGGTGLGPRDVTVEAARGVIERDIPGIAEAMRAHGQQRTPYAMLSRGVAGVIGKTVIVTLPGSSRGVKESLDAIFPYVLHAYPMMGGGGH